LFIGGFWEILGVEDRRKGEAIKVMKELIRRKLIEAKGRMRHGGILLERLPPFSLIRLHPVFHPVDILKMLWVDGIRGDGFRESSWESSWEEDHGIGWIFLGASEIARGGVPHLLPAANVGRVRKGSEGESMRGGVI